jgi:adenosylmethionine---8-amino-7-oxononanoate aminotransferase
MVSLHPNRGPDVLTSCRSSIAAVPAREQDTFLWHPFTQMGGWASENAPVIESGDGVWLADSDGRRYIDGISSLWCNVHGHGHPAIDRAVKDQLGRVAHTTMLGLSHGPADELARRLIELAPDGLARVFYSDSGSTAVEIALKMAFQYWRQATDARPSRTSFVSLDGAYHGDTVGSVSVGGIDLFHSLYRPLLFDSHRVPAGDTEALAAVLAQHGDEIAAVVVEPLVQGAAGMQLQPRGYLRDVRHLCDRHDLFLICDEVATGFGRTGTMFACEQEQVVPDFLCLAKGLTGGYLPLAATLTTERVFDAFLGDYDEFRSFFHGHTYTGNPLACAAALASLGLFEQERTLERLEPKTRLLGQLLRDLVEPLPHVAEIRRLGFMCGIELASDPARGVPYEPGLRVGHSVTLEARRRGAIIRPLGDVVVLMPPLAIEADELEELVEITADSISAATESELAAAA